MLSRCFIDTEVASRATQALHELGVGRTYPWYLGLIKFICITWSNPRKKAGNPNKSAPSHREARQVSQNRTQMFLQTPNLLIHLLWTGGEECTCTAPLHSTQPCCDSQPTANNASSQTAALPPWFFTFPFCSQHRVNSLLWQRQQGWILSRVVIPRFIYSWHVCLQLQLCCLSACLSLLMAVEPRHCRAFQQDGLMIISCHT